MKRVSYVHGFIPTLAKLLELFHKLLKKYTPFWWGEEHQRNSQKVKDVISSDLIIISSVKGLPLTLYLNSTNKCFGALPAHGVCVI